MLSSALFRIYICTRRDDAKFSSCKKSDATKIERTPAVLGEIGRARAIWTHRRTLKRNQRAN